MEVVQPRRGGISVLCPLPGSYQRSGCSPHTALGQGPCPPATSSQPGSRGRWGRKPPPHFCKQPDRQENRHELTPQHSLGTPMALGCRERPPRSAPCTPSPLRPATATPYSHHSTGAASWPEQQKPAASPSSKIPCRFFSLTPEVIY